MRLAASLLTGALVVASVTAHAEPSPAPRIFFDGGITAPVSPSTYSPGYGIGAGLETRPGRFVSMIAQAEVHALTKETATSGGVVPLSPFGSAGASVIRTRLTLVSTLLGVRFHTTGHPVRHYFDVCGGVRIASGAAPLVAPASAGRGVRPLEESGLIGAVRTGVTLAGFFADVGYEFPTRNPLRNGLLPLRVGIALP